MRFRKYIRRTKFWGLLFALLGVTSACDPIEEIIGLHSCMYGTPTAKFSIKGTVTDEAGEPLNGIKVTVSGVNTDSSLQEDYPMADTLTTDTKGTYILDTRHMPWRKLKIRAFDTDGELNGGQFAPDSATVSNIQFKDGDGSWYFGEADVDVPAIKMKREN